MIYEQKISNVMDGVGRPQQNFLTCALHSFIPAKFKFYPTHPYSSIHVHFQNLTMTGFYLLYLFIFIKRLKAAVDLTVFDIFSEVSGSDQVDKETIALASELVLEKIKRTALDLETFSGHAKRSTINSEDVRVVARNNTKLVNTV